MRRWMLGVLAALALAAPAIAQTAPKEDRPGSAYLVVLGPVFDRAKMGDYAKALAPIYATNGGRYIGFGGPGRGVTCITGGCDKRSAVIVKFKDYKTLDAFWWGEDYRKAVRLRDRAGVFTVYGVQGFVDQREATGPLLLTLARTDPRAKKLDPRMLNKARIDAKATPLITGARGDFSALEGDAPYDEVDLLSFPDKAAREAYLNHRAIKDFLRPRAGVWIEMLAIDPPAASAR